jgi:hypothetical protein
MFISTQIITLNTSVEAWVPTELTSSNGCIFGNYAYPTDNGQIIIKKKWSNI